MKNELLQILNGRRVLAILILLPIIFTLCFGELFAKNSLTGVPIIVVNLDDGTRGQKFLRDLSDTPEVKVILIDGDAADIEEEILRLGVSGAIIIPKDYSQKISRGESVSVEVLIDNSNTISGGTVIRAAQSVISAQSAEASVNSRIAAGWSTYRAQNSAMTLSTRIFYNPTGGYTDFFLTLLIVHSVQIAIVFTLAPAFVEEKKSRREIFERPIEILAEKIFVFTVIEVAIAAVCFAIGIKFFELICRGNFFEMLAIITAFVFAMVSFSLGVSAWFKVAYHTISYTLAYVMPSILFTGAIWPRYSMDNFSLILSYVMPIGHAANDLRNLFLKGVAFGWETRAGLLILFGGIFFVIGVCGLKFSRGRRDVEDNSARISPAR